MLIKRNQNKLIFFNNWRYKGIKTKFGCLWFLLVIRIIITLKTCTQMIIVCITMIGVLDHNKTLCSPPSILAIMLWGIKCLLILKSLAIHRCRKHLLHGLLYSSCCLDWYYQRQRRYAQTTKQDHQSWNSTGAV